MESLIENGLDGLGEALCILINEAMKIERTDLLQATPYERSENRVGQANGFKDKTVRNFFEAINEGAHVVREQLA